MASGSALRPVLTQAKEAVDAIVLCTHSTTKVIQDPLDGQLGDLVAALSVAGQLKGPIELSCGEKEDVWHIVMQLWVGPFKEPWNAKDHAYDDRTEFSMTCWSSIKEDELSPDEWINKLIIYQNTGAAYIKAGNHEAAESALSRAQKQGMRLLKVVKDAITEEQQREVMIRCMDIILDRLTNAWKLQDKDLASDLLAEATELARQAILPDEQRLNKCRQIIQACLERGQQCLNAKEKDAQSLLDHANQLITEDLAVDSHAVATPLKAQVLRLLSQAYLLNGNAARAHACVLDARSLLDPIADSPDLCLTAIQALVKLEEPEKAGAELLALIMNRDASASQCLAAISAARQASPPCSALKRAAGMVVKRFADDATVPHRMVSALLASPEKKLEQEEQADVKQGAQPLIAQEPSVDGQQEGLEGLVRTLSRTLSGSLSLDLDTNSALEGFIYDIDSENEWLKALNSPTCEELEPASGSDKPETDLAHILGLPKIDGVVIKGTGIATLKWPESREGSQPHEQPGMGSPERRPRPPSAEEGVQRPASKVRRA